MASKVKEDEKNERIIRGLLKLPANRKCINCNSLGPQYVCTNFWTFICTNCSGIHREFTHRVKSISMAKFSSQEVSSLQEGGNERAKAIYFKDWDSQRQSFPDSSNIDRLREFIKHVYEDQRFAAGRNSDRPPKRDTEDSYDKRKVDSYQGSRSPQYNDTEYNDTDGRRYGEMLGSASAASNYNTSPGRFDRDDRSGHKSQNRNIADQQFPHGPKLEVRPPSHQRDVDASKSPRTQPVGVVSNFPPAPTGEGAKPSGFEFPHSSANAQNTASSSSRGSSFGNSVELKVVSTGSLIDFDADPVSLSAGAMDHPALQKTTSLPAESGGWASFDDSFSLKVTQVTSAASTADTVMSQLSIHPTASATEYPSLSTAGISSAPNQSNARQLTTNQQHMPSLFQAPPILSSNPPFSTSSAASVGVPDNQVTPTMQGLAATLVGQSSLLVNRPLYGTNIGISPQPTSAEPIPSGRKELPADLFTMTYPSSLAPFPYYHPSQNVMGYGMQYPTVLTMPIYPPPSTPSNPFSFTDEPKLVHASTFPNLAPLQGALPNVDGHASILRTSSVPTGQWLPVPTGQWLPQQIPISTVLQSPYLVQQGAGPMPQPPPNTMYPMRQTTGGFNAGAVASNISGIDQSLASRSDRPHSPNSFTPAGNPFG